ncbi:MAG: PAS domain-containing sensor histidine kinase [Pseudanabaenaceae cyanobacterium]
MSVPPDTDTVLSLQQEVAELWQRLQEVSSALVAVREEERRARHLAEFYRKIAAKSVRQVGGSLIYGRQLHQSEERFRQFVENAQDLIFTLSRDGRITYISPNVQEWLGRSPMALADQPFGDFLHPEDSPACLATHSDLVRLGRATRGVLYRIRHGQGRWQWHSANVAPLRDADGHVEQWLWVARDVTAAKQTEALLRRALAEAQGLNAILDTLTEALVVVDTAGYVTYSNPAFDRLYGLPGSVSVATSYRELPLGDLGEVLAQILATPDGVLTAKVNLPQGGRGAAVAATVFRPATATEPEMRLGVSVLVRDITQLERTDRLKAEFISTVAHEVRTPLTSVLGFVEMVRDQLAQVIWPAVLHGEVPPQRERDRIDRNLSIVTIEAERLLLLVEDMLDIAKMEAGKIEWRMGWVAVPELCTQAIAATAALAEAKGLPVVTAFSENCPLIWGDRDRLVQVLVNLLSNAIKFTEMGQITCRVQEGPQGVQIAVVDTGEGIAPADCARIFEKFEQVQTVQAGKPKGTGLGLPICRQIIEHHGGQIWVESTVGQGSTFWVALPLPEES